MKTVRASGHSCSLRQTFSPITKSRTGGSLVDAVVDPAQPVVEEAQVLAVDVERDRGEPCPAAIPKSTEPDTDEGGVV